MSITHGRLIKLAESATVNVYSSMRGTLDKPENDSALISFFQTDMLMTACHGLDLSTCREVVWQGHSIFLAVQAIVTPLHNDCSPELLPRAADPVRPPRQRAPCHVDLVIRRDFLTVIEQNSQSKLRTAG
jgi:hypothetical protein